MRTIPAKTVVSDYFEGGWFGSNYNMNIYKGCCHGCIYYSGIKQTQYFEAFVCRNNIDLTDITAALEHSYTCCCLVPP